MTQRIRLIALDIDGTILNSKHELSERTERALRSALAQGIQIILATGKTQRSSRALIEKLDLATPGIYVQGLAIYNGDGSLHSQQTLDPAVARRVITFGEERGYTMAAYSGHRILARALTPRLEAATVPYYEPGVEVVGPLHNIVGVIPINKVIAFGPTPARVRALRWQLQAQLNGSATLMQAGVSDMLEVLPPGASKGAALKRLLKTLKIPAEQVLAIGDGENDIDMLRVAGIGVAMANAAQPVKDSADHVTASNDEDGVAQAIERFVLHAGQPGEEAAQ